MSIAAVILFAASAPVASPLQFNLECVGEKKTIMRLAYPPIKTEPIVYRFRIDLRRKIYCQDECETPYPIFSVTDRAIQLAKPVVNHQGKTTYDYWINRITGEFYTFYITDDELSRFNVSAMCERTAFTPIPPLRRRF